MSSKIGRNELCPCGSGLKYKKCCLKKAEDDKYSELRKYDKLELVSFLASLLLLPINQSKQLRIEEAIWDLLSEDQSGNLPITYDSAIQDVNTSIEINHLEDPTENLFTQNIMFYGGNYTVYPGISSESVNQLQMILDSINSMKDDIGNTIIGEMLAPTLFMLRLSNSVAETVGHTRYMSCVQDQWNQLVGYGNQTTCDQYMDAICFSEERLHELGVTNWSVFEPFLFQKEDLVAHEYNSVNNLFCSKPLYKTQDSGSVSKVGVK